MRDATNWLLAFTAKLKIKNLELRIVFWSNDMSENVVVNKSFDFAVRIVKLYKHLIHETKDYDIAKQLLRSGTSIGANIAESQKAQSKADFLAKLYIALKEANETEYWIRLLYKTDYISETQYKSMNHDVAELISLLTSICKTTNNKQ